MKHLKWLGGLAAMALLLSRPQAAARGAAVAMAQWHASVAPALFPFLALMPLLTCGEAIEAYGSLMARPMEFCFKLPGAAAPGMIVGMAAGTPAGALAARDIAARSGMNRGQLQRLASATAGFSPAFLVGGVGAGMLRSPALGWKLLATQLLTQLTLLLWLRRAWAGRMEPVGAAGFAPEDRPIRGAVLGILTICGYMTLFGALAGALGEWTDRGIADAAICLLDVPSGALWMSGMALQECVMLPLIAGMCGFGGLCVIAQSLGALKGCGVNPWEYVGVRALAGLLSAGYMALLQRLPALRNSRLIEPIRENPLAAGALLATLLVIPMLIRRMKAYS